jgi:NAD(P)-dependent dehydrogenase (short-subunit alcohol dehydrogenase family)
MDAVSERRSLSTDRPAAFVTGASSGIGLALASMLADEGHDLTVLARRPDRLAAAADGLRSRGVEVHEQAADVGDEAALVAAFAAHAHRFGRLDVLVNNAGVALPSALADISLTSVEAQLGLNIRAVVLAYREAAPLLVKAAAERDRAVVLNVASVVGRDGRPPLSVYSATKAAVIAFTQAMQKELGPAGVRSCAICPSFVDTPFTDLFKDRIPAHTMIRPQDVAALARPLLHLSAACVVPELIIEMANTA